MKNHPVIEKSNLFSVFLFFSLLMPGEILGEPYKGSFRLPNMEDKIVSKLDIPVQKTEKVRKGIFLVADPHLRDPNFVESVVLITEHGSEGTVGVVVNRETTTPLSRVFPEMKEFHGRDELLFIGGPVLPQGMLLLVRTPNPLKEATLIFRDVYLSSNPNTLAQILDMSDGEVGFRVFSGHAGWAPGQLDGELTLGAWSILTARSEDIFEADPDTLWELLMQRSQQQYIKSWENFQFFYIQSGPNYVRGFSPFSAE